MSQTGRATAAAAAATTAGAKADGGRSLDASRLSAEGEQERMQEPLSTDGPTPERAFAASTAGGAVQPGTRTGSAVSVSPGIPVRDDVGGSRSVNSGDPPGFGSFEESKADSGTRGLGDATAARTEPAGVLPATVEYDSNNNAADATERFPSSSPGTSNGRNKRVSPATLSEAERLLASLLLVDKAAVAEAPTRRPKSPSLRQLEGLLAATTTVVTTNAAAPACGSRAGYFTSSSGIRVRL